MGEKGSASGSRSAERRARRRALYALSEGHMPLSRVEPRMNSSLAQRMINVRYTRQGECIRGDLLLRRYSSGSFSRDVKIAFTCNLAEPEGFYRSAGDEHVSRAGDFRGG